MEWEELTCERESFELLDGAAMGEWRGLPLDATKEENHIAATRAFHILDSNGHGIIDQDEAEHLLSYLRMHPTIAPCNPEQISMYKQHYYHFFRHCEPPLEERVVMKTQHQRAKAVFDIIDLDCSGYLEPFELAELLLQ